MSLPLALTGDLPPHHCPHHAAEHGLDEDVRATIAVIMGPFGARTTATESAIPELIAKAMPVVDSEEQPHVAISISTE